MKTVTRTFDKDETKKSETEKFKNIDEKTITKELIRIIQIQY